MAGSIDRWTRRAGMSLLAIGAAAAVTVVMLPSARADEPATKAPASADAADAHAKASGRTLQDIVTDLQASSRPLQELIPSPAVFTDPAKRKEVAPKAVPILKKMVGYLEELRATKQPQAIMMANQAQPQLDSFLVVFGDDATRTRLEKQTKDTDKEQAAGAKGSLLLADWILAGKDSAAQTKLAAQAKQIAADHPKSDQLTQQIFMMGEIGAASPDLATQVQEVASSMQTQSAAQIKQQVESQKKQRALENKPLVIAGRRNDGTQFSTADWKGKVILVDFWATWCGPCRAELPRVKKAYATWHDKGLEVLGVSCDNSGEDLQKFLAENKDMPWPQLFDPKTAGWHPLATEYGIMGIPTMFLIDKKGVVRTVNAREDFEERIPKMLEEK